MSHARFCWMIALLLFTAAPALAQTPNDEVARQHFQSGKAYFERAEYDDAVREFEAAYRLSGRAALLINISRAHESAGRAAEAAEALERWQQAAPADDPLRSEVQARLTRLRAQAEKQAAEAETEQQPAPEEPQPTAPEPAAAEPRSTLGPWILMGTGGALAATGAVFLVLGQSDIDSVENPGEGDTWSDVEDQYDRGPRRVAVGIGLASAGVAALGGGLVWYFLGRREDSPTNVSVGVAPTGLRIQGRF